MIDSYALFSQPRRPWLDLDALKAQFHALAAVHHPDAHPSGKGSDFATLNAAYDTLRDPASRLAHLLALENHRPAAAIPQPVPSDLADAFMESAALRHALRNLQRRRKRADSAVARAFLAGEMHELQGKANAFLAKLAEEDATGMSDLRELDALWPAGDSGIIQRAIALQHRFVYLRRWASDLREQLLELTLI